MAREVLSFEMIVFILLCHYYLVDSEC